MKEADRWIYKLQGFWRQKVYILYKKLTFECLVSYFYCLEIHILLNFLYLIYIEQYRQDIVNKMISM